MTDLSSILVSNAHTAHRHSDNANIEGLKFGGHSIRSQLVTSQHNTQALKQCSLITALTLKQIIKVQQTNCVKELNLVLNNISQLKSVATNQIFSLLRSVAKHWDHLPSRSAWNNSKSEGQEIESAVDFAVEQYILMLLIKINAYLNDNGVLQSFKVIIVYQLHYSTSLQYKQLLTFIPYVNQIPMDGQSEFVSIDHFGLTEQMSFTAKLVYGEFDISSDWLSIEQTRNNLGTNIQIINGLFSQMRLKGFLLRHDIEKAMTFPQARQSLLVSGLAKHW